MKFSIPLLASVLLATSAQALSIKDFANLHDQQPLSNFIDKIDRSKNLLVEKVAEVLNFPINEIPKETYSLWNEMQLKFPTTLANLNMFTRPLPHTKKEDSAYDFHVSNKELPNHKLRIKSIPEALGIDTVKQYSGYLDVEDEDKHFFYWFFESRNDPKTDPVILWLNGGPGCSSMTGLFFELGPSSIGENIKPVYNPHSWNSNASVIFLDQPVNVGYSYSSNSVSNTVAAGKDVYAFLELFFQQFPEYAKNNFHIAGESYAGHYIPVFASEILTHPERHFNLTSVMIGNGLTDPLTQYSYYEPMACGQGGEPSVLSDEECDAMLDSTPRCLSLIESCYNSESVWSCVPASIYCNNAQMGPYQRTGRNVYDIRTMCEGELCYKNMEYIDEYLNQDAVKAAVGAEVDSFQSCNFDINRNFLFGGDWMKPYHKSVTNLLEQGIPTLIYAGDKDFICNWLGNQAWTNVLEWSEGDDFAKQPVRNWIVDGETAGEVKNYDHFTFLRVFNGGHMVPYDQPKNSLSMVNNWIKGDFKF